MTPEQRQAQELLDGEQPEEHVWAIPGRPTLELRYTLTIEQIGHSVWWRIQIRFVNAITTATQAAPNHGRALQQMAVALLADVGKSDLQAWRYDRARHIGQLCVSATDEEVSECMHLQAFEPGEIRIGTISDRIIHTRPDQN